MFYISEKEYEKKLKKIQKKNLSNERKKVLEKEKNKYKTKRKPLSASKMILLGVVLLCLEIVLFSQFMVWHTGDTSFMYVLIGIPATLIPTIWGYYSKAKAENISGGITYDIAMAEIRKQNGMCDEFSNDI